MPRVRAAPGTAAPARAGKERIRPCAAPPRGRRPRARKEPGVVRPVIFLSYRRRPRPQGARRPGTPPGPGTGRAGCGTGHRVRHPPPTRNPPLGPESPLPAASGDAVP
ncbi:hypothetical protein GCM10010515_17440 [Streptomyces fructofermentans]|uniref:Uncharacterized protein n=1 Tax=Streptomyces fructofermentans TaxID=152141 RepID=A0A918K7W2_9ACTN|nr:hypothetical protein GCM10010515_17440 [Streptomyces fructofermentans]